MSSWNLHSKSTANQVSDAEWAARVELAAAYRIFAYLGWSEIIYNHLSVRVPGEPDCMLINPFGLTYDEVCASNLVKTNNKAEGLNGQWPPNVGGITSHWALHDNIADAYCVMHVHTTAGVAVACHPDGLLLNSIHACQLQNLIAYHDFEGVTTRPDEGVRIAASIQDKPALIMRNHGLLTWGNTVARAFTTMWLLNRACEIQLAALSMGTMLPVSPEVQRRCADVSFHFNKDYGAGQDLFDAMVRKIDRIDPSYRT